MFCLVTAGQSRQYKGYRDTVTHAEKVLANDALCGKLTETVQGRIALVKAETGLQPVFWQAQMQMEDDSVVVLRVEPCPDGCGQASLITEALPELGSMA